MRPGFLNTCLASLYFLIASAASPRDKYREAAEHLPEVVKSVTQDLSKEPTCDELRAMWRFSKRQSRAAESTNEIPTYRDPFAYNVWEDHASIRSVGGGKMRRPLVYGRLVHSSGYQRPRIQEVPVPERNRGFEDLARMFGSAHMPKGHSRRKPTTIRLVGGNGLGQMQTGSFQHLKELIQSERARELHEQKMSEESAARDSALQYRRMIQDSAPSGLVPYGHGRSRSQLDPIINFPDVLAPSNDYYTNYNYMPRSSYPELPVWSDAARRYLLPFPRPRRLGIMGNLDSSPSPLQVLPLGYRKRKRNALTLRKFVTPSIIDREIIRLSTEDYPNQIGKVDTSPEEKRSLINVMPVEFPDEQVPFEWILFPFTANSQTEYPLPAPFQIPRLAAEEMAYDVGPQNFNEPSADFDLEISTPPVLESENVDYIEPIVNSNDEICYECLRLFANIIRNLVGPDMDKGDEEPGHRCSFLEKEQANNKHLEVNSDSNQPTKEKSDTERGN